MVWWGGRDLNPRPPAPQAGIIDHARRPPLSLGQRFQSVINDKDIVSYFLFLKRLVVILEDDRLDVFKGILMLLWPSSCFACRMPSILTYSTVAFQRLKVWKQIRLIPLGFQVYGLFFCAAPEMTFRGNGRFYSRILL